MPAESEAQRRAACAALTVKRGKAPVEKLQAAAKSMYESMSEEQLVEFCGSKVKD